MTSIINWNARSIRSKKAEILNEISKFDIFCVTETKLKSSETFNFPGYFCVRKDRLTNGGMAAGGVMICIRKNIKFETIIYYIYLFSQ